MNDILKLLTEHNECVRLREAECDAAPNEAKEELKGLAKKYAEKQNAICKPTRCKPLLQRVCIGGCDCPITEDEKKAGWIATGRNWAGDPEDITNCRPIPDEPTCIASRCKLYNQFVCLATTPEEAEQYNDRYPSCVYVEQCKEP